MGRLKAKTWARRYHEGHGLTGRRPIQKIVIAGGGTSGWSAAACLARFGEQRGFDITLVDSSAIGTIGVGEASVPNIINFNAYLGIDELDFIRSTQATFKLGIDFRGWTGAGTSFFHPFGRYGARLEDLDFHQCLMKAATAGECSRLDEYSLAIKLARQGKFAQPVIDPRQPLSDFGYAFHFDATLYAQRLRTYAIERGVCHIDQRIVNVDVDAASGFISGLALEDGSRLAGDLFIDCSGFRALLIEGALNAEYVDWSRFLPCDRAIALPSPHDPELPPFTSATAQDAGWTWRIPLQHRTGNGYVYCSNYASDEAAVQTLAKVPGISADQQPNVIRFNAGARREFWTKNCVALGLAGGFIEPLESTSINLVHRALSTLMDFFPDASFDPRVRAAANRRMMLEQENIRDFIMLHYKANGRHGEPFWDHCRAMEIPDTLAHKIETYQGCGYLEQYEAESFKPESWLTMYNGFGITPDAYDARADQLDVARAREAMAKMRRGIAMAADQAMPHAAFVRRFCAAPPPA